MKRGTRAAIAIGLAVFMGGAEVAAQSSVWWRARNPEESRRQELLDQADALLFKLASLRRKRHEMIGFDYVREARSKLEEVRRVLERAGGETSPNLVVRARYGQVLNDLKEPAQCARVLESVVKHKAAPAPLLADTWSNLAICYAHLSRRTEEIKAYDAALLLEPHSVQRSRLTSNRAEAEMALGNLGAAVADYREAIALLTTVWEMHQNAPTVYWGLAVALDRAGELDAGLEAIRLARSYDPADRKIQGPGWFYSPDYDEHWYKALGHWSLARGATLAAARTESYLSAVSAWEEYIQRAPPDDRYLPIARARLKLCESERGRSRKQSTPATRSPSSARD